MPKIFIIDDEPTIIDILSKFLTKSGFDVVTATEGQKVLETLKADPAINLMIMDMKMPGVKGIEILKALKKLQINIPVIVLTGTINLEKYSDELIGVGYNMDDAFQKPVDLNVLLEKIREKLKL